MHHTTRPRPCSLCTAPSSKGSGEATRRRTGRITGGHFLQALIQDPAFAWLAPLTRLIISLDEVEESASVLASIRDLLSLRPEGSEFQSRYAERIDRDPDLAFTHGLALAELRSRGGSGRGVAAEERLAGFHPARKLEL